MRTILNVLWLVLSGLWLAVAAIAPLGKEVVPTTDPRAALGGVSF